jgi:LuxR family transcriptional regulator, maltose regulon positive regulatory protein
MVAQILATKLYIPPPSPNVVLRARLIERLNKGLNRKLTIISAPAGFGKTTLISEWANCCGHNEPALTEPPARTAWLSLDEADSDPARFLTYMVAALRTVVPGLGDSILGYLQSNQPLPIEPILIALINDISTISSKIILVLDDYHVIDSQAVDGSKSIDEALTYLIEHLPANMHLVITTREDPQLPLARLRARGQLTELRASDLRFTPVEAADFLAGMGINLSPADVAALDDRVEGWIAGLQLAALALQSSQDISGFIRAFAGDHRYIMDYLVEEVLQRQPESVRSFLLQTSILDQLYGPLCDAVTGQADGGTHLQALERGNFFVVPLDNQRRWYRYHHLFADVLLTHLSAEQPGQIADLHRRASVWYEQHGSTSEAVQHALAAEDFARAADMIERVFPTITRSRQETILLGWLKTVPEALLRNRPVLCNLYAGALMQTGEMEGVETWLLAAERWLPSAHEGREQVEFPPGMVVMDQEEFRRLPGYVAMHRAGQALMLGRVEETIKHALRVLDLAPQDDYLRHGGAAALLGLSYWTLGNLEAARKIYPESIRYLQRAGYLSDSLGCALALADIVIAQGHPHEAMGIYERALRLASERGEPNMRGTADMLVGMSDLFYERNDLPAAAQCLLRAQEQGEHTGLPQNRYRWRVAMARIRAAEGDLPGALGLLEAAERLYMGDFSPNVRPIAAMKAWMWVAQGRLEEALDWAREQKLTAADDLSYLREFEHITLARILLACYQREHIDQHVQALLDRLLEAAEAGGRMRSVIEIRILQAFNYHAQGDISAALAPLQQALALAEPEGYVRIFVDEGPLIEQLLREVLLSGIYPGYTGKLLAAFAADHERRGEEVSQPSSPIMLVPVTAEDQPAKTRLEAPEVQAAKATLLEPLSQRELEVLRLFRTELSGPEIAQELTVALSTVRTHTKSIYSKLNVNNRRAAVRRAVELKLI